MVPELLLRIEDADLGRGRGRQHLTTSFVRRFALAL